MADANILESIINIVKSCDDVVLATFDGPYPDARHITNMLNKQIATLDLYFMTGSSTPKYEQLDRMPACCLYYYNRDTGYTVRLYGKMRFVDDVATKRKFWNDDFKKWGYCDADAPEFVLMHFVPQEYKFYIGSAIQNGKI